MLAGAHETDDFLLPQTSGRRGECRCVGQDSNLGTPSGGDLESLAFDQAWLPTRGPRRGRATLNLSRAARPPREREGFSAESSSASREPSMVQYFTKSFFDEVASRLNADAEWAKKASAITAKIVLTCFDRNASFLLDIQGGKVAANQVSADAPADFKFEGPYDVWTQLGKGEKDFQSLLLGGKIRFRGSLPKIMALTSQLNRITQVAQQVPKEF